VLEVNMPQVAGFGDLAHAEDLVAMTKNDAKIGDVVYR
jgi:hypothetical protein